MAGKEYVTSKGKKVQSVEPVKWVTCRCKKRCGENLDLNERNTLYDNYWSLDSDSQKKQYILGCVRKVPRQREGSRKNFVWRYSFENSLQEEVEVCKAVFENTLQIKRKRIRYTLNNSGQGFAKPDQRGMNTPKHKLSIERKAGVIAHIRSFPTVPSHYSRKTSKCIYIQDTTNFSRLTKSKMYALYTVKCSNEMVVPVSHTTYKNFLKTLNVQIHKPKKDQCKICHKFNNLEDDQADAERDNFNEHIENKEKVQKIKEGYKNKGKLNEKLNVLNFDLEAVLYTPCNKVSTIFYKRKLCTYNCTLYNLATKEGTCFIWDETEGKRGSNEIGTSLFNYMKSTLAEEIVLFSDTCGGQNRNQYITALLQYVVQKHATVKTIEHIYMVQGHSHMEVDSMHSAIEQTSAQLKIHIPYEWNVVASIARKKPYNVYSLENIIEMRQLKEDMAICETHKNVKGEIVQWLKITWMKFDKDQPNILMYKYTYNQEDPFMKVNLCEKYRIKRTRPRTSETINVAKHEEYVPPKAYENSLPLPVSVAKKRRFTCIVQRSCDSIKISQLLQKSQYNQ